MKASLASLASLAVSICVVLAFVVSSFGCHEEISIDDLLAEGFTADQIEQLLKEVRYRTLTAGEIFLAHLREHEEPPPPDPDGGGPDVPVTPTAIFDALSGGTIEVTLGTLAQSPGAEIAQQEKDCPPDCLAVFDKVYVSVSGDAEGFFEVDLDPDMQGSVFGGVQLFLTIQEDIRYRNFQLVFTPELRGQIGQSVTTDVTIDRTCAGNDIKVTLEWDNSSDLDLQLLDPDQVVIARGSDLGEISVRFQSSEETGGGLCEDEGPLFETFCWQGNPGDKTTPSGTYMVSVVPTDLCPGETSYILTVITKDFVQVVESQFFEPTEETLALLEETDSFEFQFPGIVDLELVAVPDPLPDMVEEQEAELGFELRNAGDSHHNAATDVEVVVELEESLRFLPSQPSPPSGSLDASLAFPEPGSELRPQLRFFDLEVADGAVVPLQAMVEVPFGTSAASGPPPRASARVVSLKERDPEPDNDSDEVEGESLAASELFDVGVTFAGVDDSNPSEGDSILYQLTASNSSAGARAQGTGFGVRAALPAGLALDSAGTSVPAGSSYADGFWSIEALEPGEALTLVLGATVEPGTAGQDFDLTASVENAQEPSGDEFSDDNEASAPRVHVRPIASFTASPESGFRELEVVFDSSASSGDISARRWDFDDDTEIVTTSDPVVTHTFTRGGTFEVTLEVQDEGFGSHTSQPLAIEVLDSVDLSVTKSAAPEDPREGGTLTYTIVVTNGEEATTAHQVELDDALPAGLELLEAIPSTGTWDGLTWRIEELAPAGSAELVLLSLVEEGTGGQVLTNTASNLRSEEGDASAGNDQASASAGVQPVAQFTATPLQGFLPLTVQFTSTSRGAESYSWDFGDQSTSTLENPLHEFTAGGSFQARLSVVGPTGTDTSAPQTITVLDTVDLAVSKSVDDDNPAAGDIVTFTIVTSNGTNATIATGVSLRDVLPAGLSLTQAVPSQGTFSASTWQLGSLAPGGSATLLLSTHVLPGTGGLTIVNIANGLMADQEDVSTGNDTASATLRVAPEADFSAAPTSGFRPLLVTFTDLSHGATSLTWDFGDGMVVTAQPGSIQHTYLTAGSFDVSQTASGPTGTDTELKTGFVVTQDPTLDLVVEKVVLDSKGIPLTPPVEVAEEELVHFEVKVTNNNTTGTAATGVSLVDRLPASLELIAVGGSPGPVDYDPASGLWRIGSLAAGSSATLHLSSEVKLKTGGTTITNTATSLQLNEVDTNPSNNSASASVIVVPIDLSVQMRAFGNILPPGGSGPGVNTIRANDFLAFEFFVEADGANLVTARDVRVRIVLPPGFDACGQIPGCAVPPEFDEATGIWTIGLLSPGGIEELNLDVFVDPSAVGQTVAVQMTDLELAQADANPANNTAVITFSVVAPPVASFTVGSPDGLGGDNTVTFTNTSTNASSYLWDFGDGTTSTAATPTVTHTYSSIGSFSVTLTASGPGGSDTSPAQRVNVIDLRVAAISPQVFCSSNITFEVSITASSTNPSSATQVSLDVAVPAGFAFVGADPTAGTYDPGIGRWTIPSITPGQDVRLFLTGDPISTATTTFSTGTLRLGQFELPGGNGPLSTTLMNNCD